MPLDIKSTTKQKVPIRFSPLDADGNPAKVDGAPVLSVTSGSATPQQATPEELATGLAGYIVSEDTPGTSVWEIEADADLGAGVRAIQDGGNYVYGDPEAESFGLSSDAPIPK
jgi:hypothetical protein